MSDPAREGALDPCGCCEGPAADESTANAPGLPALRRRIGTHSRFLARMLHALPFEVDDPEQSEEERKRPLERFTARITQDPGIALLDACAVVADVLAFYQERIANEGFLRTATERRSVLELARAIGYELGPGVSARVPLSFTVEDARGAPGQSLLPEGTQVQSVPSQGKLPQVFETGADFLARAEWNALRPRRTRPAELAIVAIGSSPGDKRLCLLGPKGSFPNGTPLLAEDLDPGAVHRLDVGPTSAQRVDAVEARRLWLGEDPQLGAGDLLLFVGTAGDAVDTLVLRVAQVVAEPETKRVRVDVEPLPEPSATAPVSLGATTYAATRLQPARLLRTGAHLGRLLGGLNVEQPMHEAALSARILMSGVAADVVAKVINAPPPPPIDPESGAFAFGERLGFFGNNAPKWKSLPDEMRDPKKGAYPQGWDAGDTGTPNSPRPIWTDSQGNSSVSAHAFLERAVKGIVPRSWVVIESPDEEARAFPVYDARAESRADYGISGRATALSLADAWGNRFQSTPPGSYTFRKATAHAVSRRLEFAELPIGTPVEEGAKAIELDRMVLGLSVGQPIVLSGRLYDARMVDVAEEALLADVIHGDGRTTLLLKDGLKYGYVRDELVICANVVPATHGESVDELLGSGDASQANQRFVLKKPPLTHVSDPEGARSTLEVRVNGVRWQQEASLYGLGPRDEAFVVRIDDDASAHVVFGDGERGARLPTGQVNVRAHYRSGIGPDGEVEAGSLSILRTIPLGLRSVTNAVPARGAGAPERLADARRNAPRTVLTFDRVVSLRDFEDYARAFPGIGKALVERIWVGGRDIVHLSVTGATGGAPDAKVHANLIDALARRSDGSPRIEVQAFALRLFRCEARISIDPRYVAADVRTAVENRLRSAFAFEVRDLAQPVTPAEVMARIHEVEGVVAVDLEQLVAYDADEVLPPGATPAEPPRAIAARRARWDPTQRAFVPAELLLIDPAGIRVEVP